MNGGHARSAGGGYSLDGAIRQRDDSNTLDQGIRPRAGIDDDQAVKAQVIFHPPSQRLCASAPYTRLCNNPPDTLPLTTTP